MVLNFMQNLTSLISRSSNNMLRSVSKQIVISPILFRSYQTGGNLRTLYISKRNRNFILGGSTGLLVTGFLCYRQRNDDNKRSKKLSGILPHVEAAKVITPEDEESGGAATSTSKSHRFNFIADVVEKTAPAVVYLEIKDRHPFFGNPIVVSNGSGFIIRDDGLILTNAHVVANKASVTVKLQDGRIFNGIVDDVDTIADLATIKIQCKNLPILRLGSSSKLRPGEWVVAMGSPLSLSNTITAGVISTVHRESKELGLHNKNMEYIQTDASINFGNSGGPLVNLDGEAIGINTMKVTAGISFAIPADYALEFLKRRDEKAKNAASSSWFNIGNPSAPKTIPKRKYIGITMISLTPSLIIDLQQRQPGFPDDVTHGVLVWKVLVGSPAYKGGLYPGDVITHINGKQITSTLDVNTALETNSDLSMNVLRKRKHLTIKVVPESD